MPDITRLIPWLQGYAKPVLVLVAVWIVYTAVVLAALLLFKPRSGASAAKQDEVNSQSPASGSLNIQQETRGNNSPAVIGGDDVNIRIEDRPAKK